MLKAFGSTQARWAGTNNQDIDITSDERQYVLRQLETEGVLATYICLPTMMNEIPLDLGTVQWARSSLEDVFDAQGGDTTRDKLGA